MSTWRHVNRVIWCLCHQKFPYVSSSNDNIFYSRHDFTYLEIISCFTTNPSLSEFLKKLNNQYLHFLITSYIYIYIYIGWIAKYSVNSCGWLSVSYLYEHSKNVNANKTEYMCYNQTGNIATLDGASLKLVDKFTYLGSSVSSTEKDIDTRLTKAWTAIDRLSIIWKSDLTDKMKRSFFQAAVVSILLYGCTTWTLTKRLERKLDGNYTRMLRAVLNKSWRQHPTRLQLYGHLPPITKTIQVRRTRHAGHCWRSKDELISDILLWTPTYGCAKVGRPARTYIQQLCEDAGCNPEDLPEAMNDREKWRERVRDIRAGGATWWWWWWLFGPVKPELGIIPTGQQHYSKLNI